jgi:adenylylsulfate kinase-like enzyme
LKPEITVRTADEGIEACVSRILAYLKSRGLTG